MSETVQVQPRETLLTLLRRLQFDGRSAHALVSRLKEAGLNPRAIRARDPVELQRDASGAVVALSYAPSAWQRFEGRVVDGVWQAQRVDVQPEVRVEVREGRIERSLWDAVESGAVDAQTILDLVGIFESDFDFASDAQPGDRFRLLVESHYADGKFVEVGRILAARYEAEEERLIAVGFEVNGRLNFYGPEGESLKKTFLRSPLQFTRISSGFTHRRPHPVLGGVRPHLAIDYAAPTGTPVWAVADATVEFAGRKGGNGIQVLLRHRSGYKTYYNHLSRVARGIRPGVRVQQKAVIGYVGSTGLSTGPHLDYRVSVNGRFVNPLSEKFLPGDPVPAARRAEFVAHAQQLIAQLDATAEPPARAASVSAAHTGR
ncbi:MAG: peptidoglycan DD-metalloendopeptidase family protein [Burkholderiaceae bacterium]|nr:peptidoglycan DD-metalloendopeptidase family protein [Burkholderiaceae bacterium]